MKQLFPGSLVIPLTAAGSMAVLFAPVLSAAPGDPDQTFGNGGNVTTAFGSDNDYGQGVAVQSDGMIVVAGTTWSNNQSDIALARYTAAGGLDPAFNVTGKVVTPVGLSDDRSSDVIVQPDGKILVVGAARNAVNFDVAVVRYTGSGALDTTFNETGRVTTAIGTNNDFGNAVALQTDGKILVAGASWNGSNDDIILLRYTPSGVLDTSFNGTGKVRTPVGNGNDYGLAVTVQPDGMILVSGHSHNGSNADFALVRYTTTGSLDTNFGTDGKVTTPFANGNDYGYSMALQSDGKIIVAGSVTSGFGSTDFGMARYTPAGDLDTSFNGTGKVTADSGHGTVDEFGRRVAVQSDGKIIMGGHLHLTEDDFVLFRFNAAGTLDTTFNITGVVESSVGGTDSLADMVLQGDGKILLAGSTFVAGNYDVSLARYEVAPSPTVVSWGVDGITATAATIHGTISPNGFASTARVEFGVDTTYSQSAMVSLSPANGAAPQNVSVTIAGLSPSTFYHYRLVAINSFGSTASGDELFFTKAGNLDPTFGSGGQATTSIGEGDEAANAIVLQNDGKIVVAGYSYDDDDRLISLARYTTAGELDTTFNGTGKVRTRIDRPDGVANGMALQSDGKIVVAGEYGSDIIVLRYTSIGALDTTFNSVGYVATYLGDDATARSVAVQSDGKIVVAGTSDDDIAVLRYTSTGELDPTFNGTGKVITDPSGSWDAGNCIALQSDGKILVGGETAGDILVLRYTVAGALDTTFNGTGVVTTDFGDFEAVYGLAVQTDGKIVIAGSASDVLDSGIMVARYTGSGAVDTAFGDGGRKVTHIGTRSGEALCVALQSDGKIVAAGYHGIVNNREDFAVVRFTSAGEIDLSFNQKGYATADFDGGGDIARAVAVQSDGKIVVAGETFGAVALARFNGSLATDDTDHDGLPDQWESPYFPGLGSVSASDDTDKDGNVELMEAAFDTDPRLPDAGPPVQLIPEAGYLTLTVPKRPGFIFTIESADGPGGAFSNTTTTVLIDNSTTLKVRDNVPIAAAEKRFMRLRVSR